MDIRVKKTKRAIQKNVYRLAAGEAIEKDHGQGNCRTRRDQQNDLYSHYETLDALTAEMERQTVQLVCDNMRGAQQLLDEPEAFVCGNVCCSPAGNGLPRCGSGIRDEPLYAAFAGCHSEKIKGDNIEPSHYENVGAILIFVMNGLSGLLNTDAKPAQKHQRNCRRGCKWCPWSASFPTEPKTGCEKHLPQPVFLLLQLIFLRNCPAPQG